MKKIYLLLILIIVLFIAGCGLGNKSNTETTPLLNTDEGNLGNDIIYAIEMNSDEFSPNILTINVGSTVEWINKDTVEHWPASAMHPTHTVYPGSDIKKCGTSEEKSIFDSCRGLKQNEGWSFTFNEKGTWSYHDHLNPKLYGKIVVN